MYLVQKITISNTDPLYGYCDNNARLAKLLYNAALFRIRQIFTGWDKLDGMRTANENEVLSEILELERAYPSIHVKRVISYSHLEKLLRVTGNPDFFSGLPMQTSQHVVKQAVQDFKNWLAALRAYKKEPERFLGKPKMPKYKKADVCTYTITNQDAVLYLMQNGAELKFPLTSTRYQLQASSLPVSGSLQEVKVTPYYGRYVLSLSFLIDDVPLRTDLPYLAAIDLGTRNIAAIVCTDHSSAIYKGGALLSANQWFAKQRAKYVGIMTKGTDKQFASSKRLTNLSFHHANFQLDQIHKISRSIVDWCLEHKAGALVIGVNKLWKQQTNIGSVNNQKFTNIPHALLRQLISYKAALAGIAVIEQEESYTSKADCSSFDPIPVYGENDQNASFSGKRTSRGLYRCQNGMVVNADCNGAANILRKALPDAWSTDTDFCFLASPEVFGFHELNPKSISKDQVRKEAPGVVRIAVA